jgi:hypothetical protein
VSAAIEERVVTARRNKAFALYLRLFGTGITAAHFTDEEWSGAAVAAGTRLPSGLTRRIVVEMLAASERERSLCPFCGMGDPAGVPGPRQAVGHDGPCSR